MKKYTLVIFLYLASMAVLAATPKESAIVTEDVKNFWLAYDQIIKTDDKEKQRKLLRALYLDKGTIGLSKIIRARTYTEEEYLSVINNYPKFWQSIRQSSSDINKYSQQLLDSVDKLKNVYPELKPANIYFAVGALRMPGSALEGDALIGAEMAFATKETPFDEFPESFGYLKSYFNSNPKAGLVFLNIHEYIHTQQKTTIGYNLLAQTVIEGVPEFLTEKVLNVDSPNPPIAFGRKHDKALKDAFIKDMLSRDFTNWIWNSDKNQFGMRDLAYYLGYRISEGVYNTFEDKQKAVKYMIELDYNDEKALWDFVDRSGYFDQSMATIKKELAKSQPIVESVKQSKSKESIAGIDTLTINFSLPLDTQFTDFDLGPLGLEHAIRVTKFIGFSNGGKTATIRIKPLEANRQYELLLGSNFRATSGVRLMPYLIAINT